MTDEYVGNMVRQLIINSSQNGVPPFARDLIITQCKMVFDAELPRLKETVSRETTDAISAEIVPWITKFETTLERSAEKFKEDFRNYARAEIKKIAREEFFSVLAEIKEVTTK